MFDIRYKSHHDVKEVINKLTKRKIVTPLSFNKIMNQSPEIKEGGIYVHTPYCDKICAFCNMNRKQVDNDLESYVDLLCKEFKKHKKKKYVQEKKITSIFFGGGTPTIYKTHQLERILSTLRDSFNIADDCEFTFETTLHNLPDEKLQLMEKYGVNRISIGIQTFSNRGRKVLNRTYEKEYIVERIKHLRSIFSGLICIDIIYNYLDETIEEVADDARTAVELGVDSVSFYSLMIHDGSKISRDLAENKVRFDYALEQDKKLHDKFLEITLANGYKLLEHTKISNGRDKYKYIRNINSFSDLFAIGIGAGGRIKDIEYYHLNKMISFYVKDGDFKYRVKKLSGLLQYPEVSFGDMKALVGEKIFGELYKMLESYDEKKLLVLGKESFNYTIDGVFWGNSIVAALVEKAIKMNNNK